MPNGKKFSWEALSELAHDETVEESVIIRQMLGHFADYIGHHEAYQEHSTAERSEMKKALEELTKAVDKIGDQVEDISEKIVDNKIVEAGYLYKKYPKAATAISVLMMLIIYLSTWNSVRHWMLKVFLSWLGLPDDLADQLAPPG